MTMSSSIAHALKKGIRPQRFPVLLYHAVAHQQSTIRGDAREFKYWVTSNALRRHFEAIRAAGLRVRLLADMWEQSGSINGAGNQMAITFDDGHASDYYEALPVLMEFGFPATFFVNTSTVMTKGFLSWSLILEMHRLGMSFESHGHEHASFPTLSDMELKQQLKVSKDRLEDRLGRPVRFFAAPYGEFDKRVLRTALEVGYRAVCTTRTWPTWPGEQLVHRICIYQHTTASDLHNLATLNPAIFRTRTLRSAALYFPRRVYKLGVRLGLIGSTSSKMEAV